VPSTGRRILVVPLFTWPPGQAACRRSALLEQDCARHGAR